jgi:hypothetical protein
MDLVLPQQDRGHPFGEGGGSAAGAAGLAAFVAEASLRRGGCEDESKDLWSGDFRRGSFSSERWIRG